MGWSCRKDAMNTLETFTNDADSPSNAWRRGARHFFYEIGREQEDGSITGKIMEDMGNGHAVYAGNFKIAGNGDIIRAPYGMPIHRRRCFV